MADGSRRIFISDIHLGDDESREPRKHYVWFRNNALPLSRFLDDQLYAPDVAEVVILGDLFDLWVVPSDYPPITTCERIFSNSVNSRVVGKLAELAGNGKLSYVPGNHDMAIDANAIPETRAFLEEKLPGIRFICNDSVPLGIYTKGIVTAEHGNRYCLFNAPDTWTNPGCFLPLGYFISRVSAYKVSTTGHDQDPRRIFIDLLTKFWRGYADFEEELFLSIADDCGLAADDPIQLGGLSSLETMTVAEIAAMFGNLFSNWGRVPGAEYVNGPTAVAGDLGTLYGAAASTYFRPGSGCRVMLLGHTHTPAMWKGSYDKSGGRSDNDAGASIDQVSRVIYANSGTWVDNAGAGGSYVETEEVADEGRLYVRVMRYDASDPENPNRSVIGDHEGYVEL